jgi:hypothetical protein
LFVLKLYRAVWQTLYPVTLDMRSVHEELASANLIVTPDEILVDAVLNIKEDVPLDVRICDVIKMKKCL